MSNFKRERHNPIESIKDLYPGVPLDHITYDTKMTKGDYYIIRGTTHDGTLVYTQQLFQSALKGLVIQDSFYKPTEPEDWEKVRGINYTIGDIKHATAYGKVELPSGKTSGQSERIRIPVKCEYLYFGEG